jgi:hypothetical protein
MRWAALGVVVGNEDRVEVVGVVDRETGWVVRVCESGVAELVALPHAVRTRATELKSNPTVTLHR